MRYRATALVVAVALQSVSLAGTSGEIAFEPEPGAIAILVAGRPVATYVYEDREIFRPYFKGLHAPNGAAVTRNHPPQKGIDPDDHASMHPGLFLAFGDLGGADFWRNKAKVENAGFVEAPCVEKGEGRFAVRNRYVAEGRVVCEEVCAYRFMVRPFGFLVLWDSTFQSDRSSFSFGDQEEMGLGVRVATPIRVKTGKGGRILDSQGRRNEEAIWGHTAAWCDYSGPAGDAFAGVAIMPDPANFRPCWWHVRDYGVMVANPFGRDAFGKGEKSEVVIKRGEPFRLRFGILIHAGASEDSVDLQGTYEAVKNLFRR
ncbi:MAG: PmoA family protein [Sedimentisphaerales bacterium]|nr:PmoA family protein [Sedimentisphaerales bacterium]